MHTQEKTKKRSPFTILIILVIVAASAVAVGFSTGAFRPRELPTPGQVVRLGKLAENHPLQQLFPTRPTTKQWQQSLTAFLTAHPRATEDSRLYIEFVHTSFEVNRPQDLKSVYFRPASSTSIWQQQFGGKYTTSPLLTEWPPVGTGTPWFQSPHPYRAGDEKKVRPGECGQLFATLEQVDPLKKTPISAEMEVIDLTIDGKLLRYVAVFEVKMVR